MSSSLPLIARADLFGPAEYGSVQISPDGEWLAWSAPAAGVPNLWRAPRDRPADARCLTRDRHRGIRIFFWAQDSQSLLFGQDHDGDEIFRVHAVNIDGGEARALTPPGARGFVVATSPRHPTDVIVAINDRAPAWPDLWRLDIVTGDLSLICENDGFRSFLLDDDFVPRAAVRSRPDGGFTLMRADGSGGWRSWLDFDPDDARSSGPIGLHAEGRSVFLLDSRGRDTAALVEVDFDSGLETILGEDRLADIGGIIQHSTSYRPLAYFVTTERRKLIALDKEIEPDIARLAAIAGVDDWSITARSRDDRWWTIVSGSDVDPATFWLYDRTGDTVTRLFEARPALRDAGLAPMQAHTLPSRDGLALVCYLTRPLGTTPETPLPLVLLVHGGPWVRDGFGYHAEHQWLANRGYAVLSVNFRGSSGFGKAFLTAGDREWGGRMDDDLDDAVDWAIAHGIADRGRIAIMGTSYGGYAVLSGMTRYPDRYACGVDVVGPANLETLLAATPVYWQAIRAQLHRAVGDPDTPEGRSHLRDRSPLHRASQIRRPLLIGQGANDPRVPQSESDAMVAALRAKGIPVSYALYPDEGHGFVRPENAMSFHAIVERFLARWLGGRAEPTGEQELARSSLILTETAAVG